MEWNFVADAVGGSLAGTTKDDAETAFFFRTECRNEARESVRFPENSKTIDWLPYCSINLHPLFAKVC